MLVLLSSNIYHAIREEEEARRLKQVVNVFSLGYTYSAAGILSPCDVTHTLMYIASSVHA
jgi:hypothetical protein